jgi:hypothetical protein
MVVSSMDQVLISMNQISRLHQMKMNQVALLIFLSPSVMSLFVWSSVLLGPLRPCHVSPSLLTAFQSELPSFFKQGSPSYSISNHLSSYLPRPDLAEVPHHQSQSSDLATCSCVDISETISSGPACRVHGINRTSFQTWHAPAKNF